jgi:ATP-dependent DNA helicase RecQ
VQRPGRPGQEAAVSAILSGRDTVVVLPTGGGKSLCFQVPALLMPGLTVVVSPLISLMKDQVDALTAKGLPAAFINSTLTPGQVSDRLARADRGEIKLLYVAPERFDYGRTAERLRKSGVSLLAVDEAHCISQWGHDFRPDYLRLGKVLEYLGHPVVLAMTATASPEVREEIVNQLSMRNPEVIVTGFNRPNIWLGVRQFEKEIEQKAFLLNSAINEQKPGIIYVATQKHAEELATDL